MPTYLQKGELEIVTKATPAKKTIVCEVTVPTKELERRIIARETDEVYRKLHLNYLHQYPGNGPLKERIDFQVTNHAQTKSDTSLEILRKLAWLP